MSASESRTLLIAGAAGGLGRAMVRRFLDEGWRVLGWDRDPVAIEGVEATLIDLTDWDAISAAAVDLPPLHAIVNSAGVASRTPALSLDPSDLEAVVRVNVTAAFAVARAGLPAARMAGGVIINIASVGGHVGFRDRLAYDTSKAALIAMTRHLAIEWAPLGVRVISVSPGFVAAGMATEGMASGRTRLEDVVEHTPQGRLVEPEEVAAAVVRLTDPAFSAMTRSPIRC